MNESPPAGPPPLQGERDVSPVVRALSVQSRVSNALAIGLMSVLGLGSLAWYYANAFMHQPQARRSAQAASSLRAQNDQPLPGLGRIDTPAAQDPAVSPLTVPPTALAEVPLTTASAYPTAGPPPKSPAELALERALSGAVFAPGGSVAGAARDVELPGDTSRGASPNGPAEAGELAARSYPSMTTAVKAQFLPAQRLLLPKGAFIDCTLETAIDSTLPGMTTCIMATDAFGVDGKVVLLERGTKLVGETRGQVQQGAARVFVLWSEARTPAGVIVPLASPGADELGRAGLPGDVDRHFWERFGAALLVSVIDGVVNAVSQNSRSSSGSITVNPSSSQNVLTEILKNTVNVAPTVVKRNGDRIQVLVARDLDFRSVYELRSVHVER